MSEVLKEEKYKQPRDLELELEEIDGLTKQLKGEVRSSAAERRLAIEQTARDEGRELSKVERNSIDLINTEEKNKLDALDLEKVKARQEIYNIPYTNGDFDLVQFNKKTINLREKTEQLFAKLQETNTEVFDAHFQNIKCIDADCTYLVFVDLGAATQGGYSTITKPGVVDDYVKNALTGGNVDLTKEELGRLILQQNTPPNLGAPHPAICGGAIHPGILVGTAIDAGCGLPSFADDLEGITEGEFVEEALPPGVPTTIEGIPTPTTSSPEVISPRKLSVEVDLDITIESGKFRLEVKKYTYDPVDGWKGGFFGRKPDAETRSEE